MPPPPGKLPSLSRFVNLLLNSLNLCRQQPAINLDLFFTRDRRANRSRRAAAPSASTNPPAVPAHAVGGPAQPVSSPSWDFRPLREQQQNQFIPIIDRRPQELRQIAYLRRRQFTVEKKNLPLGNDSSFPTKSPIVSASDASVGSGAAQFHHMRGEDIKMRRIGQLVYLRHLIVNAGCRRIIHDDNRNGALPLCRVAHLPRAVNFLPAYGFSSLRSVILTGAPTNRNASAKAEAR